MAVQARAGSAQRLVAVVIASCVALQLLLVPVHLALVEHLHVSWEHAHAGGGHAHGSQHGDAEEGDGGDEPHPAEDHLDPLAELVALPDAALVPTGLPPPAPLRIAGIPARAVALVHGAPDPRPPPPRSEPDPRGPPLVV